MATKEIMENLKKDLYYEYSRVFREITLADIKDFNRIIDLLIEITMNVLESRDKILELKNDGLNGNSK